MGVEVGTMQFWSSRGANKKERKRKKEKSEYKEKNEKRNIYIYVCMI
jgi:hypothetical protein